MFVVLLSAVEYIKLSHFHAYNHLWFPDMLYWKTFIWFESKEWAL